MSESQSKQPRVAVTVDPNKLCVWMARKVEEMRAPINVDRPKTSDIDGK